MEATGLAASLARRFPHELSGGQRQRIGIARALVLEPALVVADEPVAALDVSIQAQIVNLLVDLQGGLGLTYLFISHDLSVVLHLCDRVVVMYLGQIVEMGNAEHIRARQLHPYTQALVGAIPIPDPIIEAGRPVVRLGGEMPSPIDPPTGCRFHSRCPIAQFPLCATIAPKLEEKAPGQSAACHLVLRGSALDRMPVETVQADGA